MGMTCPTRVIFRWFYFFVGIFGFFEHMLKKNNA